MLVFRVGECDTWGAHNNEGPGNGHATATKLIDEVEHNSQDDDGGEELEALKDVEGEAAVVGWFAIGVPPGGGEGILGHFILAVGCEMGKGKREREVRTMGGGEEVRSENEI